MRSYIIGLGALMILAVVLKVTAEGSGSGSGGQVDTTNALRLGNLVVNLLNKVGEVLSPDNKGLLHSILDTVVGLLVALGLLPNTNGEYKGILTPLLNILSSHTAGGGGDGGDAGGDAGGDGGGSGD